MKTALADVAAVVVAGAAFLALYVHFGLRLSHGEFLEYWNLAFDLDSGRFLKIFTQSENVWDGEVLPPDVAIKHPLIKVGSAFCHQVSLCQIDPKAYVIWLAALHAVATNLLMYACLRILRLPVPEAVLAAAIFAISAAQLFNALIFESYVIAGTGIAAFLALTFLDLRRPSRWFHWLRLPVAVHLFGVTTTNLVIGGITDLIARVLPPRRRGWLVAFLVFWAFSGIAMVLTSLLVWPGLLQVILSDPVDGIRQVIWTAPHEGEKSIVTVPLAFLVYSAVAPEFTAVRLDSGSTMLDFRDAVYGVLGWLLVSVWLAALVGGCWSLWRRENTRRIFFIVLSVVLFNLLFHVFFQYRGSLYIYVAHVNFSVFLIAAGTFFWTAQLERGPRLVAYGIGALFLVGLAIHNMQRASFFVQQYG